MDRLICGDVGYGKTEIALRAAFKAVQEGKQVVYLVPTTILAQQHYNTFIQRMKDFPVQEDQKAMWATISLVMDHREIRLFRSYTGGSILPINCAYLAPIDNE